MRTPSEIKYMPVATDETDVDTYKTTQLETPLLSTTAIYLIPPQERLKQFKIQFYTKSGRVINMLAMVNQGIFAGLLVATLAKLTERGYVPITLVLAPPVAFAAFRGKDLLVYFFNERNWRALADQTTCELIHDLMPWRWKWDHKTDPSLNWLANHSLGIINTLFVINMALTFGGLARVSLHSTNGAAKLASDLGWHWLADNVFANIWVQLPLIVSSFLANLLGFGNMHRGGIQALELMLTDFYQIFCPQTIYQEYGVDQTKAVFSHFTDLINTDVNYSGKNTELNQIKACFEPDTGSDPMQKVSEYYIAKQTLLEPLKEISPSFFERSTTWLFGVAALAACGVGFWNFLDMPEVINEGIPDGYKIPEIWLSGLGIMCYTSIMLLASSVYKPVKEFTAAALFDRHQPDIDYYDHKTHRYNTGFALVMCLIGALPNIFQALLAKEGLLLAVFAAYASFNTEIPAVSFRYHIVSMLKSIEEDTTDRLALGNSGATLFNQLIEKGEVDEKEAANFVSLHSGNCEV